MSGQWALIGRDDLIDEVLGHLRDPGCDGVFLVGRAGVGTTRVLDEVNQRLRAAGRYTNRVVGSVGNASTPYAALAHVIPGELTADGAALNPLELFERIRAAIQAAPRRAERFVSCIDNAEWLDRHSLGLLTQLLAGRLACAVAAVHADEPLADVWLAIEQSCTIRRVVVPPLRHSDMLRLVDAALDGAVDGTTAASLAAHSGGHPLLLGEMLDGSIAAGRLAMELGTWRLRGAPVVTGRAGAAFDAKVWDLDEPLRDLVDLIALAEPVTLDALQSAGLLVDAGRLETRGLITTDPATDDRPATVRLAQPMHAAHLRARISPLRRRVICPLAIDVVELADDPDDVLRLTRWRLECGLAVSGEQFEQAAQLSRAANDFETTVQLCAAANRERPSFNMLLVEAEALVGLCRFDEAEAVLARAESLAADEISVLRLGIERHKLLLWGRLDGDGSAAVLRETMAKLTEPLLRDAAGVALANAVGFSGRHRRIEDAAAVVTPTNGVAVTLLSLPRSVATLLEGDVLDAVASSGRGQAEHEQLPRMFRTLHPGLFANVTGWALVEAGSFVEADAVLGAAYRSVVERRVPQVHIWLALSLGRSALNQGELGVARRWFVEARSVADDSRFIVGLRCALTGILICAGQTGDLATTRVAWQAMRDLPADEGLLWPERQRGVAWALVNERRLGAAVEALLQGADEADERGETLLVAQLLYDAARLGAASTVRRRFADVAARCTGPMADARAAFVFGVADRDHLRLIAAEKAFANLGAWLGAAEAAAELAKAFAAVGRTRDAQGATARCEQYRRGRAACTPALVPPTGRFDLSPREREVVSLATELPSKVIAQRLGISVRTVSNHLQNAYVKLGVTSRDDLTTALARIG